MQETWVFKKTIMNKYGTYDKGPKQNTNFAYLRCGILDREGFIAIIVKFLSPFVEQHEVKIIHENEKIWCSSKISNRI